MSTTQPSPIAQLDVPSMNIERFRVNHGLPDNGMFIVELADYKLYNPDTISLYGGDELFLSRVPNNPSDKNAIEVFKSDEKTSIGFLPREVSEIIAPLLDEGKTLRANFFSKNRIANGMIVVSGEDIDHHVDALQELSLGDTNIYAKKSNHAKTVDWYDRNADFYAARANQCNPENSLMQFLSALPKGAKILDAGCGNGRDILTMLDMGFKPQGFDASGEMCRLTAENTDGKVIPRQLRFEEFDDAPGTWDGVWAMASLLHLPPERLEDAIERLKRSLKPGGQFYASFKLGEGYQNDDSGRFFNYVLPESVAEILSKDGNVSFNVIEARSSNQKLENWINIYYTHAPEPELIPQAA